MSRHYGDPTTDAPAPPPSPVVKHASQYFFEARKAVEEMYGPVDINNSLYGVSMEVMLRFAREVGAIDTYHVAFIKKKLTIYGVEVIYDAGITGGNCVLLSGDNEYHFEIPEAARKRKPPRPKCPPGEWQYTKLLKKRKRPKLWRFVLSVIDWLNSIFEFTSVPRYHGAGKQESEITFLAQATKGVQVKHWHDRLFFAKSVLYFDGDNNPVLGAELVVSRFDSNGNKFYPDGIFEVRYKKGHTNKIPYEWQPIAENPKRKYKHDEIEITVLEERMQRCRAMEIGVIGKALDCSDCYSKCEEWYNVAEKTKAKTNGEQMATLGELFEGYEEVPTIRQPSKTPHTLG